MILVTRYHCVLIKLPMIFFCYWLVLKVLMLLFCPVENNKIQVYRIREPLGICLLEKH